MIRFTGSYVDGGRKFETRMKIWEVEQRGKMIVAQASTSRVVNPEYEKALIDTGKCRQVGDKYYVNSSWNVRFIFEAFNKAVNADLKRGDTICINSGEITYEPYTKQDGSIGYSTKITIRDFDFVNDEYGTTNQDKAPEVAHKEESKPAEIPAPEVPANEGTDDSEELPF